MDIVQTALKLSIQAHKGQVDKAGEPYINHPVYLALQMNTDVEKAVALLHDVLEDSNLYTYQDIYNMTLPIVAFTIELLTHKNDETYFEYIDRIKNSNNSIAIKVKLADLKHNSDLSRIQNPTDKDYSRLKRYQQAIKILNNEMRDN